MSAEQIVIKIKEESDNYYNCPWDARMSDEEFDKLVEDLRKLDPSHPYLKEIGSIPVRGEKYTHDHQLYSLEKAKTLEEFEHWFNKLPPDTGLIVSSKLDGLALAVYYEDGVMVRAVTRGDGIEGEVVTAKARKIKNLPKRLPLPVDAVVIGECIIPLADFEEINADETYTNARNLAAGTINQDDPEEVVERRLKFVAYNMAMLMGRKVSKWWPAHINKELLVYEDFEPNMFDKLKAIKDWGFEVVNWCGAGRKIVVDGFYRQRLKERERGTEKYQTDGVCVFVDSDQLQKNMGYTSHHPKFAIAIKYPSETVITIVESISWEVSRNGIVTPVANLAPVGCGGAIIKRATVHNAEIFSRELRLKIGDRVKIKRSNDVIPYIMENLDIRDKAAELIGSCPCCGDGLEFDGIRLICDNELCEARLVLKIEHFLKAVDFKGLSDKSIAKIVKSCEIDDWFNFFAIEVKIFQEELGYNQGLKIAQGLHDLMDKGIPIQKFLRALGIIWLGKKASKMLAPHMTPERWEQAATEENPMLLTMLISYGFGPVHADCISKGLKDFFKYEWPMLEAMGFKIKFPQIGLVLENALKFCPTGKFSVKRSEVEQIIESKGHEFTNTLTKNVDYLVTGEGGGSKRSKAEKLGVKVITEKEMRVLIGAL